MGEAFRSGQSLIVKDLENAEGYMLRPLMTGARSEMAIPLMIGQEAIGVVVVETTTVNRFTEADIQVMKTLVDLIAVAVQNARLYAQAQQFAVAEERNRLARELHDSVSQALYGIVLGANTAQALLRERQYTQLESAVDYVLALAKAGLEEIRASIFDLRPVVLEDQGLMYAVRGHLSSLQTRHHIQVESLLCDEPDVPFATKEALYRVVREALHNIVKHAQATRVVVEMTHLPQTMVIRIGDNGRGFDMARATDHSLGLKSMRERVKALDGALHIHSMPGEGTEITVHIPL
jgi:signal transduction histidine kinase